MSCTNFNSARSYPQPRNLALAGAGATVKLPRMTPDSAVFVRTPADLVDAVPYVLGFHPTDSLVAIGMAGRRVSFGARYDLPPPGDDDIVHIAAVIAAQAARSVTVIGYGPVDAVDPVMRRALEALDVFRVRVTEALRVHEGRWWSYYCDKSDCCPPDGNPCHTGDSVIAAEATYRGQVALPSRQALVAQVATVEDEAAVEAMAAAGERARQRLTGLLTEDPRAGRSVRRAGRVAVREAEKTYRAGRTLTDDEVAWLGVLLIDPDVNEYALDRSGAQEWRFRLWTDVLRRVERAYVPAPACLLGYAAWRDGRGALARVAVDRALMADPRHPMAGLLDEVLGYGIGPHAMTALDSMDRRSPERRPDRPRGGPRPRGTGSGPARECSDCAPECAGPARERSDRAPECAGPPPACSDRAPEGCGPEGCGPEGGGPKGGAPERCGPEGGGPKGGAPERRAPDGGGPEGGGPGVQGRAERGARGREAGGRERSSPGPARRELGARAPGARGSRGLRSSFGRRLR